MKYLRYVTAFALLALAGCDDSEGWIELRNESERAITSLTITECDSSVPGANLLNQGPLAPGETESFRVDFGCYDVEILTEDELPGAWPVRVNEDQRRVILVAVAPVVAG